ncbi:MAG TPA: ABC transporter permease [Mycobacteriales bacterium]|jgi:peptide/nickel transport system permease protein|nr:ABC transporter permease [Mycobacteriales bacterium]
MVAVVDAETARSGGKSSARRRPLVARVWRSYVLRRIGKSLITLYLVISLSFFLLRYMPGNPIQAYVQNLVSTQGLSQTDALSRATSLLSFNPKAPIYQQYVHYIGGLLHGDMGQSITSPGTTVRSEVFAYLPWTLFSVGLGTLISFVLGITLGVLTAYRRGGVLDHLITNISSLIHAVPNYIWAMLILVVLGARLGLFNVASMRGTLTPGVQVGFTPEFFGDVLYHAFLPVLVYALTGVGGWILVMKSSTVQVLDEDFVTVARARGLRSRRIRMQYVGRNAILPLFAQFALAIGGVVGGSVLIEQIFQYQGVGYYLFDSLTKRDYTLTQGFILIMTISVIAANLVADLLLSRIDPRVRAQGTAGGR